MKSKVFGLIVLATLAGANSSLAQDEPRLQPTPSEPRPPLPPPEMRERVRRERIERAPEGQPERRRERRPTPYLGVVSLPAPPVLSVQLGLEEGFGLFVENVLPDSPALAAGIQRYDVLKMLNDQQLMAPEQLARLVQRLGKDAEATVTFIRKGQEHKATIKIGEKLMPERMGPEGMGFPGFERPVERRREGGDAPDRMREMHERMRNFQESMRRFQEQMREWQKNPSGDMPKMPELPEPARERSGGDNPQPGVHPADLLREMRPGSGPGAPGEWSDGSSRWDAGRARVKMRDNDGELEVTMKEGKRVLTIKSPQGELIFTGPVDSPEERAAIPEQFRGKLSMMAPPPPRNDQRERPPMLPPTRLPSERGPGFQ